MRNKKTGGFFLCLMLYMLIGIPALIPAAVLLLLHFFLDISIWWTVGVVGLWFLGAIIWTCIIQSANRYSNIEDPPKKNINPYSAKDLVKYDLKKTGQQNSKE